MPQVRGYATHSQTKPLEPFKFVRRDPGDRDVQIEIGNVLSIERWRSKTRPASVCCSEVL